MKKILVVAFLFLAIGAITVEAKTITLTIPDADIAVVENDVVSAEVWIQEAWAGKLAKCRSRAAKQYEQVAITKGLSTIPTTEAAKASALLALPEYKKRSVRDAEEAAKLPK